MQQWAHAAPGGTDLNSLPVFLARFLAAPDARLAPTDDLTVARGFVEDADIDGGAEAHRRQILEFVDAHDDALQRSNRHGHLTGSTAVFDLAVERVVLLHHRKLQRWLQPGGHADGDANLAAVALREATEETGIDDLRIDPVAVDLDVHEVAPPAEGPHLHLDARFVAIAPPGSDAVGNHESTDIAWVALDDLDRYDLDAGTHRMISHARERLVRHPG